MSKGKTVWRAEYDVWGNRHEEENPEGPAGKDRGVP
ncbi:hypothetical protein AH716_004579 [Salmonella enterica subsp. enterica]|nr:hypothetical protein [Salmonella enterica subsp. enterica]EDT6694828.1 hypothetical protein [Salmonella enterica subsp. enterica serovar Gbadago]